MHNTLIPFTARASARDSHSEPSPHPILADDVFAATGLAMNVLGLPFDIARAQYARAVQLGLLERSMLASRDFSRTLSAIERLALGPWARHV